MFLLSCAVCMETYIFLTCLHLLSIASLRQYVCKFDCASWMMRTLKHFSNTEQHILASGFLSSQDVTLDNFTLNNYINLGMSGVCRSVAFLGWNWHLDDCKCWYLWEDTGSFLLDFHSFVVVHRSERMGYMRALVF